MNPEPRLTASQRSDRDLFRQLPQPMLVVAMEGSAILDANPVAAAMYRCQVADLTGLLVEPADNAGEASGASRQASPGATIFFGKSRLPDSRWIQIAGDGYDILYAGQSARVIVLHDRAPAAESHPVDGEFQLRRILAGIDEGLLVVDGEGTVRFANPSASQLLGRSSAQLEGHRLPLPLDLCDGDELDLRLPGRAVRTVEARIGTTTWSGEQARIYTLRDVSARRATENRMRLLERAIESSKSGVVIADALRPDHPILYVNRAFERITGYSRQEVIGRNCRFLQNEDSDQPELATIRAAMGNNDDCEVLLRNYRKDGTLFWNQLSISPVRNDSGTVTNYLAVQTDVSERRGYEAELAHHANHDAVTGLPCYRVFEEYTRIMIAEADRTGGRVAMLYINMDRFHTINETMGHHVGDRALKLIGERLEANIGDGGKVCRVSSDEFACVIPHYHGELDPEDFAVQLQRRMEAALPILPYRLYLTCCIGIASHPEVAASPAELLHFSQVAMTRAKRTGRNSCLTFSSDHVLQMRERLLLGSRFRDAILNDELVLHYQPQISAHSGRITGVEALVRWQTKDMGLLMPMRFIQVAEDLGLIVDLGRWVLEAACRQAREWQLAGHDDISMAVNVSTLQLQRPSFITEVDDILKSTGLAPRMLEIELTESAIMENIDSMGETILALKRLGVRLALDDFGVGYSSLNYLRRFPIDKLKIDRSFIQDISNNAGEAAIARAIIAMGHQLQMTVIAEGVENESQVGYLRRNHCDEFQGYLFEKPMPAAEATAILGRRFILPATLKDADRERTLLLVDDEENVLRSLVRLFRRDGYLLLTANSAQEALDILARNDVQVILSDQRMPEINGTEFLSTVKELYPETLRLVLSGCTDSGTITDAINRGAIYKFLAKPWDEADLRQQILDAFRATENRGDANRAA